MRKSLFKSKIDSKTFDATNEIRAGQKSLNAAMQALENYAEPYME